MPPQTHYSVLNVTPKASTNVIRAAYKALALEYHPDKTSHLDPEERARRATQFRAIQEAHDVLINASQRAWYDAEIEGNLSFTLPDAQFTASNFASTPSSHRPTPRGTTHISTSAAKKEAMRADAEHTMAKIREARTKRDEEESSFSLCQLRSSLNIWKDTAEEHRHTPTEYAHCIIRIHEYEQKIAAKEAEHAEWLKNMAMPGVKGKSEARPMPKPVRKSATAKHTSAASDPSANRFEAATTVSHTQQKAEERRLGKEQKASQDAARAEARAREKARQEALKQAHVQTKAKSVREEKEKQQRKASELAKQHAERIAKARAKARSTPLSGAGKVAAGKKTEDIDKTKPTGRRAIPCRNCGMSHGSFVEWKRCSMKAEEAGVDDESYFHVV